jgi:hypothetical protein
MPRFNKNNNLLFAYFYVAKQEPQIPIPKEQAPSIAGKTKKNRDRCEK